MIVPPFKKEIHSPIISTIRSPFPQQSCFLLSAVDRLFMVCSSDPSQFSLLPPLRFE
jgi:hypothetical protein